MAYQFDFASVFDYTPVLIKGIGVTVELIAFGAVAGVALGIACAWARTQGRAGCARRSPPMWRWCATRRS